MTSVTQSFEISSPPPSEPRFEAVSLEAATGAAYDVAKDLLAAEAVAVVVSQVVSIDGAKSVLEGLVVAGVADRPRDRGRVVRILCRVLGVQTLEPR